MRWFYDSTINTAIRYAKACSTGRLSMVSKQKETKCLARLRQKKGITAKSWEEAQEEAGKNPTATKVAEEGEDEDENGCLSDYDHGEEEMLNDT